MILIHIVDEGEDFDDFENDEEYKSLEMSSESDDDNDSVDVLYALDELGGREMMDDEDEYDELGDTEMTDNEDDEFELTRLKALSSTSLCLFNSTNI